MNGVIWHEVECGSYSADLPLWEQLAEAAAGPVLELGCGTGRVALHLARRGHPVTGLDNDPDLVAELHRRAAADGLAIEAVEADARSFSLPGRFALVLAPMQIAQLLDPPGRDSMLASIAAHLAPEGLAAVALASAEDQPDQATAGFQGLPDVRELDGWVYSSLPVEVRRDAGGIEVRRLRQTVSPAGELSEKLDVAWLEALAPADLEARAGRHRLRPAGRHEIAPTRDHSGSVVVLLEAER